MNKLIPYINKILLFIATSIALVSLIGALIALLSFNQVEEREAVIFKNCRRCELFVNGIQVEGKRVSYIDSFNKGDQINILIINRWYGKPYQAGVFINGRKYVVGNGQDEKVINVE